MRGLYPGKGRSYPVFSNFSKCSRTIHALRVNPRSLVQSLVAPEIQFLALNHLGKAVSSDLQCRGRCNRNEGRLGCRVPSPGGAIGL